MELLISLILISIWLWLNRKYMLRNRIRNKKSS